MDALRRRLAAGDTLFTAWSAIPDPLVAETLARSRFGAVTLDMQHGFHSTESVLRAIAAVRLADKPAIVRIPVNAFDMASRALDFGASAVIAPMINSQADAEAFAAAMKFPPLGERSWGPHRAMALHGVPDVATYLAGANAASLAIAMVETPEAFAALDDILAVPGIDGVFVGPSDLSVTWTKGGVIDATHESIQPAVREISRRAAAAGKFAAIFTASPAHARRCVEDGYRLVALGSDTSCLLIGADALLDRVSAAG